MYIWVVLVTFMTLLYAFNLSVRGDERRLAVEPLAEAEVSRFAIHHRMGQQYIREHSPKSDSNPVGVEGDRITYDKGILDYETDLADYAPFGFQVKPYDAGENEGYKTEVYCAVDGDWSTEAQNCAADGVVRFLVTYGPIPERWLNHNSGTPNNDFLNALQNIFEIDNTIGYATETSSGPYKMQLQGREDNVLYLPNLVVDSGGFSQICSCSGCRRCLVYFTSYVTSEQVLPEGSSGDESGSGESGGGESGGGEGGSESGGGESGGSEAPAPVTP